MEKPLVNKKDLLLLQRVCVCMIRHAKRFYCLEHETNKNR